MKAIEGPFNPTYDSLANYNIYFQTCFIFFYAGIQYAVETVSDKKVTVVHARWTKWVPNRHQRIGRNGRRSIKGWLVKDVMADINKRSWMLVCPLSRTGVYIGYWSVTIPRNKIRDLKGA